MTWKMPRSSSAEYFKSRYLSLKKKNTLNTEIWSTVYRKYTSFWKPWRKTAHKQKYEIAQCQLPEITLSNCILFILLTIDMSSSSRIEKLPSSYSSVSAEWKVLHKKINNDKKKMFIFFIWSISENSVHSAYATGPFQEGKFVKIVLRVSVFLTSRAPFRPGFVSVIYLLWMFHDKKLTPL